MRSKKMTFKVMLCCVLGNMQKTMARGFQKSYCALSQLKGPENCDLSKLEVQKKIVKVGSNPKC